MKTNQEHFSKNNTRTSENGIGLVYVLIIVALFAALSFTLMRMNESNEASILTDEQAELYANQLISYTVQAKSVVDQMLFSGTDAADLTFVLPGQAGYNGTNAQRIVNIYHPDGGGLNAGKLPEKIFGTETNPISGLYMGRFNNVDWTNSSNEDVILTAYDIPLQLCQSINDKITGNTTIPAMTVAPRLALIDNTYYTGAQADLTTANCAACEGYSSLCVSASGGTAPYAFYNILIDR